MTRARLPDSSPGASAADPVEAPAADCAAQGAARTGAAVVLLALFTRALEAIQQGHLFNDGPRFLAMAEAFAALDWRTALEDSFHPLTSVTMAALGSLLPISLETAGQLASVLAGGLAAWAIWDLSRRLFGPRIALAAGLVFALQPRLVASSSGVQSDGLHLAFFLLGSWAVWRALAEQRARFACVAGMACALAYLTRPEGLAVAVILSLWLVSDAHRARVPWTRAARLGSAFALCFALLAAPYIFALHEITGDWMLTGKKSLSGLLDLSSLDPGLAPTGSLPSAIDPAKPSVAALEPTRASIGTTSVALTEVLRDGMHALQLPALLLLVLGLSRGQPTRQTRYVLSFAALFFVILLALRLEAGYVSRRHWLAVVALLSPFIGRGALRCFDGLRALPFVRSRPPIAWIAVASVIGAFLAHAGIPQTDAHKIARQRAAHWLRGHAEASVVASARSRDAYFAGAEHYVALLRREDMEPDEADPALRRLEDARERGSEFVLLDQDMWPADRSLPAWLRVLHRATYRGTDVIVLELEGTANAAPHGNDPVDDAQREPHP